MKNGLLILVVFLFSMGVFAQQKCSIERPLKVSTVKSVEDVGDFTITDSDGNTWNLYDELAQGKTVFIDLFFTT